MYSAIVSNHMCYIYILPICTDLRRRLLLHIFFFLTFYKQHVKIYTYANDTYLLQREEILICQSIIIIHWFDYVYVHSCNTYILVRAYS